MGFFPTHIFFLDQMQGLELGILHLCFFAILSVFPYNYFNSKVEKAVLNIEKYATSLEIVYEKLDSKHEASRS